MDPARQGRGEHDCTLRLEREGLYSRHDGACKARDGGESMAWWSWVIGGAIFLGAELAFVNAQFYFVFVGSAAIVVGLIAAGSPGLAAWLQWAIFAALALVSMVLFRRRLYGWLRGHPPAVAAGPAGGTLTLPAALEPGQTCQAEHGGSFWAVRNDGQTAMSAGTRVRIVRVDGLTLLVRAEHPQTT